MRLIDVDTLELRSFTDDYDAPPYAILSHCWGDEEVTLQDVLTLSHSELNWKAGWKKIVNFCLLIKQHPHLTSQDGGGRCRFAWVDTCCIDKTSSAELSEAINSMFRWYRKATCCFVWLPDVEGHLVDGKLTASAEFEGSRWFTRGWTLQELLAPCSVHFFDSSWRLLGTKMELADRIEKITSIDWDALVAGSWDHCNIAQRMSWVGNRRTTRREDLAYCLMGLFDVNMPLLYGEGDKAFIRLQEEIMRDSDDQSIFAWDASTRKAEDTTSSHLIGALATHPSQFKDGSMIETLPSKGPATLTARGIQIDVPIISQQLHAEGATKQEEITVALLSCRFMNDINSRVGIHVSPEQWTLGTATHFVRERQAVVRVPWQGPPIQKIPTIYIAKRDKNLDQESKRVWRCVLQYADMGQDFKMICAEPKELWTKSPTPSCTMVLPRYQGKSIAATVAFTWGSYPDKVFYAVMKLAPNNEDETFVGLTSSDWVDESNVHKKAKDVIEAMKESEGIDGAEEWLEIDEDGGMIQAQLDIRKDCVFEVSMSKMVRRRLPTVNAMGYGRRFVSADED